MGKIFSILLASALSLFPVMLSAGSVSDRTGGQTVHDAADPAASPESEVVFGNARFTVLTPRLVRMEWSADGKFEDRATLGIVNRRLDVPEFEVRKTQGSVIVKTDFLTLKYKGQENFNEKNLSISFLMSEDGKEKGKWHPGMDDSGNLLGTARTLDRCDGDTLMDPYDPGIISRDGWAVIDESSRHLFEPVDSDWEYWVAERDSIVRQDLYFFGYGHDYTAALGDFTKIAGRIPLPPKYAFGYWWCRFWQYSDFELIDLAKHFRDFSIPIDAMIIDMDWHETWSVRRGYRLDGLYLEEGAVPESGQLSGGTAPYGDKEFPEPAFLQRDTAIRRAL